MADRAETQRIRLENLAKARKAKKDRKQVIPLTLEPVDTPSPIPKQTIVAPQPTIFEEEQDSEMEDILQDSAEEDSEVMEIEPPPKKRLRAVTVVAPRKKQKKAVTFDSKVTVIPDKSENWIYHNAEKARTYLAKLFIENPDLVNKLGSVFSVCLALLVLPRVKSFQRASLPSNSPTQSTFVANQTTQPHFPPAITTSSAHEGITYSDFL